MKSNPLLVVQTLLAVQRLVDLARKAISDGQISTLDLLTLLGEGVLPILELYGVKIELPDAHRTTAAMEVRDASAVLDGLVELINLQEP